MIETIIFDCDGTLVCSEPLAFAACSLVVNETLAKMNVDVAFTPEALMERFVGKVFWRIMTELASEHGFELTEQELADLVQAEQEAVIEKLAAEVLACDGSVDVLSALHDKYNLAVASSSASARLVACLSKTGQDSYFKSEHIFSAVSSLPVPTSKPDPAIYLHALAVLGSDVENCLAVEDSPTGVLAAVEAGIKCFGYVGAYPAEEFADRTKALLDAGATVVFEHWNSFLELLAK